MEKGMKIGLGIAGGLAAIAVIYFGFTEKGKQQWSVMFDPTKGGTNVPPRTGTAEDGGKGRDVGADGLNTRTRKGSGSVGSGKWIIKGDMTGRCPSGQYPVWLEVEKKWVCAISDR